MGSERGSGVEEVRVLAATLFERIVQVQAGQKAKALKWLVKVLAVQKAKWFSLSGRIKKALRKFG